MKHVVLYVGHMYKPFWTKKKWPGWQGAGGQGRSKYIFYNVKTQKSLFLQNSQWEMAKIENIHCTICTQPISSSWQNALPPAFAPLEQRGVGWAQGDETWHNSSLHTLENISRTWSCCASMLDLASWTSSETDFSAGLSWLNRLSVHFSKPLPLPTVFLLWHSLL